MNILGVVTQLTTLASITAALHIQLRWFRPTACSSCSIRRGLLWASGIRLLFISLNHRKQSAHAPVRPHVPSLNVPVKAANVIPILQMKTVRPVEGVPGLFTWLNWDSRASQLASGLLLLACKLAETMELSVCLPCEEQVP